MIRTSLLLGYAAASLDAAAFAAPPSTPEPVAVSCTAPLLGQPLPPVGQSLALTLAGGGLLTIVEHGQEVEVEHGDAIEIATPPRLGKFSVQLPAVATLRLRRARPSDAHGTVDIALDCAPDDGALKLRAWQAKVQAIERQIAEPQPAQMYERLAPQIDAVRDSAPRGYPAALAEHLRAQALVMTGRSAEATRAFAAAKLAWLEVGDRERALAALVAETEDGVRTGDYAKVLALTRSLGGAPDPTQYFGARLETARCIALQYLTRLDESSACFDWAVRALADLGEELERISTQQDYANVELERGQGEHAEALAGMALAAISQPKWNDVSGPDVPIVRGRIERQLADMSLRRGDIAESLRHSQSALAHFNQAHHQRWQANVLLRLAEIYREMGAWADAMDAVDAALQRLSARDAPARIARAELTKARIARHQGDANRAVEYATNARSMFDALQMPGDVVDADLTIAEAKLASGQRLGARTTIEAIKTVPAEEVQRIRLLNAEIAIAGGAAEAHAVDIAALQASTWPLSDWLRVQIAAARRLDAGGQRESALHTLELAALHIADLATRAGNPVLHQAIARRQRQLFAAALPLILTGDSEQEKIDTLWHWLLLAESAPARFEANAVIARTEDFDRALAATLLPRAPSGDKASPDDRLQQHLLELVASGSSTPPSAKLARAHTASAHSLPVLPPGGALLALLSEGGSTVLLYISGGKSRLFVLDVAAPGLRQQALRLSASIVAGEGLATIDEAAAALSHLLLGSLAGEPAPRRLWIVAPEPFNGMPWALLTWPGAAEPLVATTSVALAIPGERNRDADQTMRLHVFATAGADAGTSGRAELAAASGELASIERQRRERGWRVLASEDPQRADVLAALGDSGSWVHVAGHGSSMAEYLGRSGIWLGDAQSTGTELLSWMDVVERGARADVVVLNACALGSTPATSLSASSGFAEATLHAGANDVVAALWPINDTAASLWATTFYSRLPARPAREDIADALQESMRRLRDSRTWRHPKYWASLVHLTRVDPAEARVTAEPE